MFSRSRNEHLEFFKILGGPGGGGHGRTQISLRGTKEDRNGLEGSKGGRYQPNGVALGRPYAPGAVADNDKKIKNM